MNQDQIKAFFDKLEHNLTAHKRCFDLLQIILNESQETQPEAKKLLKETLYQFNLTQTWVSSIKDQLLETKPEKGLS